MRSLAICIIICSLVLAACAPVPRSYSLDDSREKARLYVLGSQTYGFDGQDLVLEESKVLGCDNCFLFIFSFDSSHAGYGDRSGQVVAQVITPHIMDVVIQNGGVIQAIIDNEWNELKQRPIKDFEVLISEGVVPVYYCTSPRPEICEGEEDKVCGSGGLDYQNPCEACSIRSVEWYVKGACSSGHFTKVSKEITSGKLSKDSGQFMLYVALNQ
ncbi:hypothetical protein JW968_04660 [Candidatus Woesearchaeota archaeon]|nr:hypothetical protein [Candidatus Woesearchaeota archaeon]